MIGVLTHHWAADGNLAEARKLLDRNGEAQSRALGFVRRTTLLSQSEPDKITSLVVWDSGPIYDAWKASLERAAVMADAGKLWARPPASERFDVA